MGKYHIFVADEGKTELYISELWSRRLAKHVPPVWDVCTSPGIDNNRRGQWLFVYHPKYTGKVG